MAFALTRRADPDQDVSPGERAGAPARAWWQSRWQDSLLALLLGAALLWPVVTLIVHDLTPTGMAEESVGRRYFYALRILYGEHERPFLPQGQLTTVAHFVVHLALTAAGYPPTQVFPRIDLFAYAALMVPTVLAVPAFVWAVRPITNPLGKVLVGLLLLVVVFDPGTTRGYHLVQTDYYSWVHAVALVAIGAMVRVVPAQTPLDLRSGAALGANPAAGGAPDAASSHLVAAEKLNGRGLELMHVTDAGDLSAVTAPDGGRVWVEGVGTWDSASRRLSGLSATYADGQLRLDTGGLEARNQNARFDRVGSRRQPLVGWQLEPRDATPALELLSDEDGPFMRVCPTAEGATVTISSRAPLSTLDDTPVTVRAIVRTHGVRPVTLTLTDVTARGGPPSTRQGTTRSNDTWETLTVWLRRVSFADERDTFSVKLADPTPGRWMDVREVSLIQGIVP